MNSTAAETIRRFRTNAGYSQEMLAERANISSRTVRALESGQAKRPHRDTLAAIATALELRPADSRTLYEAWRSTSRDVSENFHSEPPPDILRDELQQQRHRIRDLVIRTVVHVRADRTWTKFAIQRTFEALDDGLQTWSWMLGYPAGLVGDDVVPVDCSNIEPVAAVDIAGPGRIFHGSLGRPLARGEVYSLAYNYDWQRAWPEQGPVAPDDEVMHSAHSAMPAMLFEVRFDPDVLPRRIRQVRQATVDGPAEAGPDLVVSPFGIVSLTLLPAAPGVHGIRWEWE